MKRLLKFTFMIAAFLAMSLFGVRQVFADDVDVSQEVHIHINLGLNLPASADISRLRAPTFEIFDISQQFDAAEDQKEFTAKFPLGGQSYARNFIEKHGLKPLSRQTGSSVTASIDFIVPGRDAYLIVQTDGNGVIENAGNNGTYTLPFVFLPDDNFKIDSQGMMWYQIKGKTSLVQRSPYLFKYGRNAGGELPLGNAKFVLYRLDGSMKLYCTNSGSFKTSDSPLNDGDVAKFTSNSSGLVMYDRGSLEPGTYYFCEVQAPKGYRMTSESQKVKVEIPSRLDDGVKVNGVNLDKVYGSALSDRTVSAARPRIYNYSIENPPSNSGKTNTPGNPTTPNSVKKKGLWGMLPQTGEAKSIMALLGIGIICLVVLVSVKRRNYKEEH